MVPHIHQLVFQLLYGPHLGPLPFPPHLNGRLTHYRAALNKEHVYRLGFCKGWVAASDHLGFRGLTLRLALRFAAGIWRVT